MLPEPVGYKILSLGVAPNGRQLVLAAVPPPLTWLQIFTIDVGGGKMRQLTSGPMAALTPEFSPDGRRIVFSKRPSEGEPFAAIARQSASQSSGRGGIFTMRLDGSGQRQLTERSGDGAPSFAPSGRRIVFNRQSKGYIRIFSMRPNGGGVTQLTEGRVLDRGPVYSPDGRKILFTRPTNGRNPDLYVMRSNGTGVHLLHAARPKWVTEFGPDWGRKPR